MGGHIGFKQRHILPGSPGGGESGGRFDVIRAALRHNPAQAHLLLLGEQTGLDDDLKHQAAARLLHRADFGKQVVPPTVLGPADVDHHVDLLGPVGYGVLGLKHLDGGGGVAVGETDHSTHRELVSQIIRGLFYIAGRNTHAGAAISGPIVADLLDFLPGGGLGEQCVVYSVQNGLVVHGNHLIHYNIFVLYYGRAGKARSSPYFQR